MMAAGVLLLPSAATAVSTAVEDVQILTRGPVHEAFAESVSFDPQPGLIVRAVPPAAIEELPPEQQPEGDNVTWISGYWAWDDELNDFLWISGVWRNLPPGRQWVPGYWSAIDDGQYQWTSGYWADATTSEVAYIPTPPPRNIDSGPNIEAPSDDQSWIPGNWIWGESRYVWRPGYWCPLRSNWTWVPSRYCWTRRGYLYVDGYWDYALASRGVLFAPVYFNSPIYTTPGYYYTPGIVFGLDLLADHLFVRPRCGHYYFGDYYAPRYREAGFYASYYWHNRYRGYDPIYAYDRWCHRGDRNWENRRRDNFDYFRDHENDRPQHTWAAMRDSRNDRLGDGRNRSFATPLADFANNPAADGQRFRTLDKDRRDQFVAQNQQMRKFGQERRQTEARGSVAGDAPNKIAAREKLAPSPVIGRQAERFAKNEAPPKRPEARGTRLLTSPAGPTKDLSEYGGNNAARRSGETKGERGAVTRDPQLKPRSETILEAQRKSTTPQMPGKVTGRERETGREKLQRPSDRQLPGRKTEAVPQPQLQPAPKERPTPSLKDQSAKQREYQPKPQTREMSQRQAQIAPQPKQQSRPQIQSTPQRTYQSQPKVREAPRPQVQSTPQPQFRQAPQLQRSYQPQAQARQTPQPQRSYQPQAQARQAPPSQRSYQPQPQARQTPQPQRSYQPQQQIRQAPQRQAQAAPQRQSQPGSQTATEDGREKKRGERSRN